MTTEEQQIFLKHVRDSYLAVGEIALSTGIRSGELRGLCWQDIDYKNMINHINHSLDFNNNTPKTITSKRDIPMIDNVYNILKRRKKQQAELRMSLGNQWKSKEGLEDLVFTSEFGYPMNRDRFKLDLNAVIKRINDDGIKFDHITPHTFRHTFATRCIEYRMQPQILKAILGHSKLSMTMDLYSHVLPNIKADEMQKIAKLF